MKKFHFKQLAVCLLIGILLLSLLSCSGKPADSKTNEPEEEEKIDLAEYVFKLLSEYDIENEIFDYTKESTRADLVLDRIHQMEQDYNMTFDIFAGKPDQVKAATVSGGYIAEASRLGSTDQIYPLMRMAAFLPISEVSEIIDLADWDKWGTPYQQEYGMYNGDHYTISPMAWPDRIPSTTAIVIFNEQMVIDSGIPDLRGMLEQKTWTWDNFLTMINDWTSEAGEDSVYGTCSSAWKQILPRMAFFSNGGRTCYYDEEGNLHSDLENEIGVQALEFAKKLMTDYKHCFYGGNYYYGSDWGDYLVPFEENRCYTVIAHANAAIGAIAKNCKSFGLMPFPVGPNGSFTEFPTNVEASTPYSILAGAIDPEAAAIVYNELFNPLEGLPDRQALIDELAANFFYDPRDAEFFFKSADNVEFSYWCDNGEIFWNAAATSLASKSVMEVIDANLRPFMKIAEEYIAPNHVTIAEEVAAGSSSK